MHFVNCIYAPLLIALAKQAASSPISSTSSSSLESHDSTIRPAAAAKISSSTYTLRCPRLPQWNPCKSLCKCSASGIMECDSAAPERCYHQARTRTAANDGGMLIPCICHKPIKAVQAESNNSQQSTQEEEEDEEEEHIEWEEPETGTSHTSATEEEEFAEPESNLNCASGLSLGVRMECWRKCSCDSIASSSLSTMICHDDAPADCRTQCACPRPDPATGFHISHGGQDVIAN